ncbi:hypothetical protein ACJMK2_027381 [Sinanodonta woodiana]|uniref:CD80-like immunoglobulin C2-set domain-containing protein n=1 Tax=Sinanodonta woodiana TaxID=1069815 RepID=A0ABD3XMF0_SINWO
MFQFQRNGQATPFIVFPTYTNTSTSQCPLQEDIYISTLHLPRGANFSGNIPLTTQFHCGITHQLLGEKKAYSNVSNNVTFAVHVSKVHLLDSESGRKEWYEGFSQTLECITSPARPVPSIQWFPRTSSITNANITEINKTYDNGLHVIESKITIIPKRDLINTIFCSGNIDGQQAVHSTIVRIDVLCKLLQK